MRFIQAILFVLIFCITGHAQDINFSQFYELPLLRNPSLAGLFKGDMRVTGAYRSQWGSVSMPFVSQALGAEIKLGASENSDNYFSLGLQVTNDVAGTSKLGRTQLLPLIAFHKSLSTERDTYLSLAFMGGPVQQRFDPSNLRFDDQFVNGAYSPTNPTKQMFSKTEVNYLDGSVGLTYSDGIEYGLSYYVGAAYFHFTRPKVAFNDESDITLNSKFVLNGGLAVPTGDYDKFIIYADYFRQGGNSQAQGGFMYQHDLIQEEEEAVSISAGTFIRWNDAVMPLIKLDYYKLGVGLSYDVNISKLRSASNLRGSFELSLSFKSYLNMNSSSANKTRCPVPF